MSRLSGKAVVVTGGAGGIGTVISTLLAQEGARVLVADIDGEGAQAQAEKLRADGLVAEACSVDLGDEESVRKMMETATAQFVLPGHVKGQALPGFLGGSDLAVPVTSKSASLGADWIKDFTGTSAERALQAKGNIPNATNLLGSSVNERAAARSWFVPTAKHWVDVENGNILRNMLAQILTGKLSIQQAATSAGDNIASVLNQS